ncbi:uncharacterized protein A1O9_06465 [Exophiala aquamarina CBS 119918]|uniref:Inhibitor of growth protein N-terminal histone-binding domain-containing protein n=1 Tax=Exophiala aquamarina CBS 119918 TaxID=1182545 RepID=A0A072PEK0_9EURO|nr:uncharacterized protein A1O9_06465 [Exophiala aquamarina CBS 119918]KEF58539.1 hypothetical protein A1O9_06465 [Exophiala aquamarina CBS 119918]
MVTMADLTHDRSVDPDAQAAVTDFLDYTEYLPADLIRSLTLIRGLDETYQSASATLDDLTKLYGSLPSLAPAARPDPQDLREKISSQLDVALNSRDSSYAEACRLFDVAERHQNRLKSIIAKLNAIPKPPSRDPTPQPQPSIQIKRSRSGRKIENGTSTRLTLIPPRGKAAAAAILKRPRSRRITVPGEVMPPYDPDSPIASTEVSDWDSPPPSPPKPVLKLKQPKTPASAPTQPSRDKSTSAMEKARQAREATELEPYHKPTPPPGDAEIGSRWKPWTHLTEYEMYKIRKRMKKNLSWVPSDVMIRRELADSGRGWENYYRAKALAEAEGTKFVDLDGIERTIPKVERGEKSTKLEAVESIESLEKIDKDVEKSPESVTQASSTSSSPETQSEDKAEATRVSTIAVSPSNVTPVPKPKAARKAEPKKDKKDVVAQSKAALAAQEAELAARRLGDIGSKFRTLFTTPFASALASLSRSASTPTTNSPITGKKATEKASRKRKAETTPASSASPSAEPDTARKRPKIVPKPSPLAASPESVPASTSTPASSEPPLPQPQPQPQPQTASTIKIPLKLNVSNAPPATSNTPTPAPTTRAASVQRNSVAPKTEHTPPASSRPPSRRSAAASVEPQPQIRTSSRASMTPSLAGQKTPGVEPSPKATAASRRSKRDAPGTVMQSSQDGGAAVSVSKRKTKPLKQQKTTPKSTAAAGDHLPQIRIDVDGRQELVDPEEERYCLCGDVSWGEMICCELDDKCDYGQWFHMECIHLVELPPRTVKWYCPGDRKKYHKGETSNGLVGRGIK